MNLNLHDLYSFVKIIDHGGFAAAARALGVSKSGLSKRIANMEDVLGARVIDRSPHSCELSEVGREVYQHALKAVAAAETAERLTTRRSAEPSGVVKFSCPSFVAQLLLRDLLPRFALEHPRIRLTQHVRNDCVDVLGENYDVALRVHGGPLPDSSIVQRRLGICPLWLVASPAYLQRAGTPRQPEDLVQHEGLALGDYSSRPTWILTDNEGVSRSALFVARMHSNDMQTLLGAAIASLGITSLPADVSSQHIRNGTLMRVLPEWTSGAVSVSALIPHRRHLPAAVRAFVDFLARHLLQHAAPCSAGDRRQPIKIARA